MTALPTFNPGPTPNASRAKTETPASFGCCSAGVGKACGFIKALGFRSVMAAQGVAIYAAPSPTTIERALCVIGAAEPWSRRSWGQRLKRPPRLDHKTRFSVPPLPALARSAPPASADGRGRGADRPFPPQRVAVRLHFGEALSQSQHLSLQHRELQGVFVSAVACRFHRDVPNSWDAAEAASDRCLYRRGPSGSLAPQIGDHCEVTLLRNWIGRQGVLELRYPATPSPAKPVSIITQVDASGVVGVSPRRSVENEEPSKR